MHRSLVRILTKRCRARTPTADLPIVALQAIKVITEQYAPLNGPASSTSSTHGQESSAESF